MPKRFVVVWVLWVDSSFEEVVLVLKMMICHVEPPKIFIFHRHRLSFFSIVLLLSLTIAQDFA